MSRKTTALVTALALSAGLGLAACGNDDAGDTMTPDTTMSESPAMSDDSMSASPTPDAMMSDDSTSMSDDSMSDESTSMSTDSMDDGK